MCWQSDLWTISDPNDDLTDRVKGPIAFYRWYLEVPSLKVAFVKKFLEQVYSNCFHAYFALLEIRNASGQIKISTMDTDWLYY